MAKENVQKADVSKDVKPDVEPKPDDKGDDKNFLGDWKTEEAAVEGLANLQGKLGSQGNELGAVKGQIELLQSTIEGLKTQAKPKAETKTKETPKGPDFDKEMTAIEDKIAELDPDAAGYQKELGGLIAKSNDVTARRASAEGAKIALDAAQTQFKEALDERDMQAMHKDFYDKNKDFNTPEMQVRIQENLANDPTGMSDPMVAYREIQRDDAMANAAKLEEENTEMKRLLDLKAGEEETGKVVTQAQSSVQQKTKPKKLTGAELDTAMQGALDAL